MASQKAILAAIGHLQLQGWNTTTNPTAGTRVNGYFRPTGATKVESFFFRGTGRLGAVEFSLEKSEREEYTLDALGNIKNVTQRPPTFTSFGLSLSEASSLLKTFGFADIFE
jgi:hypothetical protein